MEFQVQILAIDGVILSYRLQSNSVYFNVVDLSDRSVFEYIEYMSNLSYTGTY